VKLGKRIGRIVGFALGAAVLVFVVVQAWFLLHIAYWTQVDPGRTSFMERRLDEMRARDPKARLDQRWVEYKRISTHLKRAVIAAEDAKFVDHEGFDWDGIQRALERNQKRGKVVAGGSTISQQLAKNLYLSPDRNPLRKVKEGVTAYRLEAALSKRRLMELYLNVAEFGPNLWGAEAASQFYFDRPATRMTPAQAASLAGSLPFPLSSNPAYRTGRMRWRRDLILRRMRGEAVEIPQEAEDETVPPPPVMEEIVVPDSL